MAQRTLVTGGAGFIGGHLVDRLLARGECVTVLDNLSSGKPENVHPAAELVVGDIRDQITLDGLMAHADSVFHLAALVSVQECISDWLTGTQVNLCGTAGVFNAAARHGGPPVVYASSAAVYGDTADVVSIENITPAPISPYGADKLGCEHHARAMWKIHELPTVGLRFFNVFGPRQDPASPYAGVISRFAANRLASEPHTIFGDGTQSRDFVYVADVVEGLLAARSYARGRGGASVVNVCTGVRTTLLELAQRLDNVAGVSDTPIRHNPARAGDIKLSVGSPELAMLQLGFQATTSLAEGLRQLWSWMQERN